MDSLTTTLMLDMNSEYTHSWFNGVPFVSVRYNVTHLLNPYFSRAVFYSVAHWTHMFSRADIYNVAHWTHMFTGADIYTVTYWTHMFSRTYIYGVTYRNPYI